MTDPGQEADERTAVYKALHAEQLRSDEVRNAYSSRRTFEILFRYYAPQSVLDVGCGLGSWLKTAMQFGISDVRGIEGA